jgi:hypothetical protein
MAATNIVRTAMIDDDGTGTTGTVFSNAWKTEFYDQIDGLFDDSQTIAKSSGTLALKLENTGNVAGSESIFHAEVGGASAGDVAIRFEVNPSVADWTLGLDNSDADAWKLSASSVLGTADVLRALSTIVQMKVGIAAENVISPPALATGNTNDYNPSGLASAFALRLSADAAGSTLTGIIPQENGRFLLLINVSANALTIVHDATSTDVYRFALRGNANKVLGNNDTMLVWRDPITLRWRQIS